MIQIYSFVRSQYINQNPFGESYSTVRLEAVCLALELHDIPEGVRKHYAAAVVQFFNLVGGVERVNWQFEIGRPFNLIRPEDVL